MLRVLFFARIREELGCPSMDVAWSDDIAGLDALQHYLCERGGARWNEVLTQDNIIRAVNQTVADGDFALQDGDEVAFFPPVTGG